jgi:hypothetical protein
MPKNQLFTNYCWESKFSVNYGASWLNLQEW